MSKIYGTEMVPGKQGRMVYPRGVIKEVILQLEPGESADFPIARMPTIRAMVSMLGMMYERYFATSGLRAERVIRVTRLS